MNLAAAELIIAQPSFGDSSSIAAKKHIEVIVELRAARVTAKGYGLTYCWKCNWLGHESSHRCGCEALPPPRPLEILTTEEASEELGLLQWNIDLLEGKHS